MIKNIEYLLALHNIDGLGPVRLKALIEYFKDPKVAWESSEKDLKEIGIPQNVIQKLEEIRKQLDPEKLLESLEKDGIKFLTIYSENYPRLLKEIYDPPIVLYYKGEILPQDDFSIAIVGTRKMTGYGKLVTEKFTAFLVTAGFTIVSGLARGVDSQAHKTSLENGGRTIAVLGGGLKNIYPPENIKLAEEICNDKGAVISEFPPKYPSLPGNFPARNRIISGLSKAVLVTEADINSGSLITARLALEQGRDVFAIPGPITSDLSKGPIELIKDGARIVIDPQEVLEELGVSYQEPKLVKSSLPLSDLEKQVLNYLENENRHIDEICRNLNISAASVNATLLKMEIQGWVRNLGGGVYCTV